MILKIIKEHKSSDGSIKFCFQTKDEQMLEAVYMPGDKKCKICISSQLGCPFNCRHCATGKISFKRNLSAEEIFEQVNLILNRVESNLKPEILYYGIGEPFLNFDSVLESINLIKKTIPSINNYNQFYIATSGIPGMIEQFSNLNLDINLVISLHVANQHKRGHLIPQSKKYPINQLKADLVNYQKKTNKRIILHYCLINDFNDDEKSIENLKHFIADIEYELHVIPFNNFKEADFESPNKLEIENFVKKLEDNKINVFYRPSRGKDILAACGQLLAKK